MDTVMYCTMRELQFKNELVEMMCSLYKEDAADHPPDFSLFPATVEHLVSNPAAGQIILFRGEIELAGYALLVPYWSNEFGGVLLFIDELFVSPPYRNRGIATRFFRYVEQKGSFGAVALALEVSPDNHKANRLYEALGFVLRRNAMLTRSVESRSTIAHE